jgi:hypothetical protein
MLGAGRRLGENRKVALASELPGIYPDSSRRGHAQPTREVHHVPERDQSNAV